MKILVFTLFVCAVNGASLGGLFGGFGAGLTADITGAGSNRGKNRISNPIQATGRILTAPAIAANVIISPDANIAAPAAVSATRTTSVSLPDQTIISPTGVLAAPAAAGIAGAAVSGEYNKIPNSIKAASRVITAPAVAANTAASLAADFAAPAVVSATRITSVSSPDQTIISPIGVLAAPAAAAGIAGAAVSGEYNKIPNPIEAAARVITAPAVAANTAASLAADFAAPAAVSATRTTSVSSPDQTIISPIGVLADPAAAGIAGAAVSGEYNKIPNPIEAGARVITAPAVAANTAASLAADFTAPAAVSATRTTSVSLPDQTIISPTGVLAAPAAAGIAGAAVSGEYNKIPNPIKAAARVITAPAVAANTAASLAADFAAPAVVSATRITSVSSPDQTIISPIGVLAAPAAAAGIAGAAVSGEYNKIPNPIEAAARVITAPAVAANTAASLAADFAAPAAVSATRITSVSSPDQTIISPIGVLAAPTAACIAGAAVSGEYNKIPNPIEAAAQVITAPAVAANTAASLAADFAAPAAVSAIRTTSVFSPDQTIISPIGVLTAPATADIAGAAVSGEYNKIPNPIEAAARVITAPAVAANTAASLAADFAAPAVVSATRITSVSSPDQTIISPIGVLATPAAAAGIAGAAVSGEYNKIPNPIEAAARVITAPAVAANTAASLAADFAAPAAVSATRTTSVSSPDQTIISPIGVLADPAAAGIAGAAVSGEYNKIPNPIEAGARVITAPAVAANTAASLAADFTAPAAVSATRTTSVSLPDQTIISPTGVLAAPAAAGIAGAAVSGEYNKIPNPIKAASRVITAPAVAANTAASLAADFAAPAVVSATRITSVSSPDQTIISPIGVLAAPAAAAGIAGAAVSGEYNKIPNPIEAAARVITAPAVAANTAASLAADFAAPAAVSATRITSVSSPDQTIISPIGALAAPAAAAAGITGTAVSGEYNKIPNPIEAAARVIIAPAVTANTAASLAADFAAPAAVFATHTTSVSSPDQTIISPIGILATPAAAGIGGADVSGEYNKIPNPIEAAAQVITAPAVAANIASSLAADFAAPAAVSATRTTSVSLPDKTIISPIGVLPAPAAAGIAAAAVSGEYNKIPNPIEAVARVITAPVLAENSAASLTTDFAAPAAVSATRTTSVSLPDQTIISPTGVLAAPAAAGIAGAAVSGEYNKIPNSIKAASRVITAPAVAANTAASLAADFAAPAVVSATRITSVSSPDQTIISPIGVLAAPAAAAGIAGAAVSGEYNKIPNPIEAAARVITAPAVAANTAASLAADFAAPAAVSATRTTSVSSPDQTIISPIGVLADPAAAGIAGAAVSGEYNKIPNPIEAGARVITAPAVAANTAASLAADFTAPAAVSATRTTSVSLPDQTIISPTGVLAAPAAAGIAGAAVSGEYNKIPNPIKAAARVITAPAVAANTAASLAADFAAPAVVSATRITSVSSPDQTIISPIGVLAAPAAAAGIAGAAVSGEYNKIPNPIEAAARVITAPAVAANTAASLAADFAAPAAVSATRITSVSSPDQTIISPIGVLAAPTAACIAGAAVSGEYNKIPNPIEAAAQVITAPAVAANTAASLAADFAAPAAVSAIRTTSVFSPDQTIISPIGVLTAPATADIAGAAVSGEYNKIPNPIEAAARVITAPAVAANTAASLAADFAAPAVVSATRITSVSSPDQTIISPIGVLATPAAAAGIAGAAVSGEYNKIPNPIEAAARVITAPAVAANTAASLAADFAAPAAVSATRTTSVSSPDQTIISPIGVLADPAAAGIAGAAVSGEYNKIPNPIEAGARVITAPAVAANTAASLAADFTAPAAVSATRTTSVSLPDQTIISPTGVLAAPAAAGIAGAAVSGEYNKIPNPIKAASRVITAPAVAANTAASLAADFAAPAVVSATRITSVSSPDQTIISPIGVLAAPAAAAGIAGAAVSGEYNKIPNPIEAAARVITAPAVAANTAASLAADFAAPAAVSATRITSVSSPDQTIISPIGALAAPAAAAAGITGTAVSGEYNKIPNPIEAAARVIIAPAVTANTAASLAADFAAPAAVFATHTTSVSSPDQTIISPIGILATPAAAGIGGADVSGEYNKIPNPIEAAAQVITAPAVAANIASSLAADFAAPAAVSATRTTSVSLPDKTIISPIGVLPAPAAAGIAAAAVSGEYNKIPNPIEAVARVITAPVLAENSAASLTTDFAAPGEVSATRTTSVSSSDQTIISPIGVLTAPAAAASGIAGAAVSGEYNKIPNPIEAATRVIIAPAVAANTAASLAADFVAPAAVSASRTTSLSSLDQSIISPIGVLAASAAADIAGAADSGEYNKIPNPIEAATKVITAPIVAPNTAATSAAAFAAPAAVSATRSISVSTPEEIIINPANVLAAPAAADIVGADSGGRNKIPNPIEAAARVITAPAVAANTAASLAADFAVPAAVSATRTSSVSSPYQTIISSIGVLEAPATAHIAGAAVSGEYNKIPNPIKASAQVFTAPIVAAHTAASSAAAFAAPAAVSATRSGSVSSHEKTIITPIEGVATPAATYLPAADVSGEWNRISNAIEAAGPVMDASNTDASSTTAFAVPAAVSATRSTSVSTTEETIITPSKFLVAPAATHIAGADVSSGRNIILNSIMAAARVITAPAVAANTAASSAAAFADLAAVSATRTTSVYSPKKTNISPIEVLATPAAADIAGVDVSGKWNRISNPIEAAARIIIAPAVAADTAASPAAVAANTAASSAAALVAPAAVSATHTTWVSLPRKTTITPIEVLAVPAATYTPGADVSSEWNRISNPIEVSGRGITTSGVGANTAATSSTAFTVPAVVSAHRTTSVSAPEEMIITPIKVFATPATVDIARANISGERKRISNPIEASGRVITTSSFAANIAAKSAAAFAAPAAVSPTRTISVSAPEKTVITLNEVLATSTAADIADADVSSEWNRISNTIEAAASVITASTVAANTAATSQAAGFTIPAVVSTSYTPSVSTPGEISIPLKFLAAPAAVDIAGADISGERNRIRNPIKTTAQVITAPVIAANTATTSTSAFVVSAPVSGTYPLSTATPAEVVIAPATVLIAPTAGAIIVPVAASEAVAKASAKAIISAGDISPPTNANVVSIVTKSASRDSESEIIRYDAEVRSDGYTYCYETSNGIAAESVGELKTVNETDVIVTKGGYKYINNEGNPVSLTYVADENGFQPKSDILPVAPPVPDIIARTVAYILNQIKSRENAKGGN